MNAHNIYWLTRIPEISHLIGVLGFFAILSTLGFGITCIALRMCAYDNDDETMRSLSKNLQRPAYISLFMAVLLAIVGVFVPDKEQLMLIVGAEVTSQVVEGAKPEIDMMRQWLRNELAKQVEESQPKTQEKK